MKEDNFSEWYNEILWKAEIMDVRYPVKGLYVWYPFGFALRRNVYGILRSLLDEDHSEVLFPLLIPKDEFMKEAEHIRGFEDEVYWVDRGGLDKLDIPLALRPTSETAMYPIFKLWVRSHADLPLRVYQIVNTFRHETKHTRPLIRLREITSFKEAHTVHVTLRHAKGEPWPIRRGLRRELLPHLHADSPPVAPGQPPIEQPVPPVEQQDGLAWREPHDPQQIMGLFWPQLG